MSQLLLHVVVWGREDLRCYDDTWTAPFTVQQI